MKRSQHPPVIPLAHALVLLAAGLILPAPPLSGQSEPEGDALPFRLAFDQGRLTQSGWFDISPDGRWAAYVIRRALPDQTKQESRRIADRTGTPWVVMGSKVHVTDMRTLRTVQACPDGVNSWRPSWSRDGRTVAFYSDAGGVPQLWAYSVEDRRCRRVSDAALKPQLDYIGNEPRWSPDGRTIFVPLRPPADTNRGGRHVRTEALRVTVYGSGGEADAASDRGAPATGTHDPRLAQTVDIGAINVASGEVQTLIASEGGKRHPRLLRLSRSGRWVSYLSVSRQVDPLNYRYTVELAVVPAAGGEVRVIDRGLPQFVATMIWPPLTYSWHPEEDRLVYAKDNRLWLVDLTSGEPSPPRELAPELGDIEPRIHWFTRDGRFVVAGLEPRFESEKSAVNGGQPQGLALIPLDGGDPTEIRFDNVRWAYEDILKADANTVWQPDGRSITLRMRETATGENAIIRFDPGTGGQTVLWKGLARIGGRAGTWNSGGNHDFLVGAYEDYSTPANVYRFSADFSSKERISHIEPRLGRVAVGSVEMFETKVPLHDGTIAKVRTAVLLPRGFQPDDRRPGIVLFYPGADLSNDAERFGGDIGMMEPPLLYTSRGYVVLLTHVRIGPVGEAGNPIKEMTDVLLPQIYRAGELGYVDATRLGLRGQSYGGYGTASIVSYTNIFRAAVPSNGPFDIPGQYGGLTSDGRSAGVTYYEGGQGRMGDHLWTSFRRYIDNSPYYQADKILTPTLLMQGGDDQFEEDARKLFTALRRLGRTVQLAIYVGEGHSIRAWSIANSVDGSRRMVEFFGKYIGAPE